MNKKGKLFLSLALNFKKRFKEKFKIA